MRTVLVSSEEDQLLESEKELMEVLMRVRFRGAPTEEYRALVRFLQSDYVEKYRKVHNQFPPILPLKRRVAFIRMVRLKMCIAA